MSFIYHVDINSYFATMMQQENPLLRGKPIGIIKDVGRSCIIASSNEAKTYGIKTGCRAQEARKLYKDIILVPAAFDIFLSSTHTLKRVFHSLCPTVHIFSLDEAFLDMRGCEIFMASLFDGVMPTPEQFGTLIQKNIRAALGTWVQCNVGVAPNKLLAKMASEISPKGSVFQITPENIDQVLSTTPFSDVCGVGYALEKRLAILGISTPYQINLLDDETLTTHFGPFWSKELRKIGKGKETHFFTHIKKVEYMQSVGRTITGYKLCDSEEQIRQILLNLLEEATYKLRRMDLAGRGIGISLRGHTHRWGAHTTLKYYVRHTNEIFDLLYNKMYKKWKRTFPIIKFGVYIFQVKPCRDIPLCLLPEFQKNEQIYNAVDKVNNRFGLFTLKPATLLGGKIIRPEVTGFLGDKTFHGL